MSWNSIIFVGFCSLKSISFDKLDISQKKYAGQNSDNIDERNAQHRQIHLPFLEPLHLLGLVQPHVSLVEVTKIADRISIYRQLSPVLWRQGDHHLVEDVIILLGRKRMDNAALVQEITVDLCTVEGTIRHLNLDEVTL